MAPVVAAEPTAGGRSGCDSKRVIATQLLHVERMMYHLRHEMTLERREAALRRVAVWYFQDRGWG